MRAFSTRLRVIAFIVAVTAFIGASAAGMTVLSGIDREVQSIAYNAGPSIQILSKLRLALIRMDEDMLRLAQTTDALLVPAQLASLRAHRNDVRQAWDAYKQNPAYPLEQARWGAVEDDMARLDSSIDRLLALGQRPAAVEKSAALRSEVSLRRNDLAEQIVGLTDYNVEQVRASAHAIETTRQRHIRIVVILDALALSFALLSFLLAHQRIRGREIELENRLVELDEFAGRAAHDLMSPLTTANIALETVTGSSDVDPKLVRTAERGKNGIARAQQVVQSLLAFARAGARPAGDVRADSVEAIRTVIEETKPAAVARGIQIVSEVCLDAARHPVACDPALLTVVLRNLVQNAIKYMPEQDVKRITLRSLRADPYVRFEVEDTGPGVPAELRSRVFEPYQRGSAQGRPGIGLGLATVRRIVEAHGGRVKLAPAGNVTIFRVDLPIAEAGSAQQRAPWRRLFRRLAAP